MRPRFKRWAQEGNRARVAVVGAGFMGRGLVHRLARMNALQPALIVNRTTDHAVRAYTLAGVRSADVVVSDDVATLASALQSDRPAVASNPAVIGDLDAVDVVVEATGAMGYGAEVILGVLEAGKDVVSLNAELDATIGFLLHDVARRAGRVYTIADGDQPGVLLRMVDEVAEMGFEIIAAVNCKRNLDVHQNPDDSRPYAERDGTSVLMTTAFGDGTKMQIECCVVANLSGLVPDVRGMHGVETTLDRAAEDVVAPLMRTGVVEFTRAGDFGGGVGVVGRSYDVGLEGFMRYAKMGDGPDHFFFRPYHLMHLEVPRTIAQAVVDRQPLAAPSGPPVAEVVAVAKRDLRPGDSIDGIGGFCAYGQVDSADRAAAFLSIGVSEGARVVRAVALDEPIPLDAVELDEGSSIVRLRRRQDEIAAALVAR